MGYDEFVRFVQGHFTDGLVCVIGSGLSLAEGIPGMPDLATHLASQAHLLTGNDAAAWQQVKAALDASKGLEAALSATSVPDTLEDWIIKRTCELLVPKERTVMAETISGARTLRLTTLLNRILKSKTGLPILTTNYDRLIELACEMAGFYVDTTAVGIYGGEFDHERSCMGSCKAVQQVGKNIVLDHYPRAIVLKPHGSLDWYKSNGVPRRCCVDLPDDRLIITPGTNKYRAGYNAPFDKHRDLANDYIKKSARLLIVGYGFNDDHLQTHLEQRIKEGTPALVLTRSAGPKAVSLAQNSPNCVLVQKATAWDGIAVDTKGGHFEHQGTNLWDVEILSKELLA